MAIILIILRKSPEKLSSRATYINKIVYGYEKTLLQIGSHVYLKGILRLQLKR